MGKLFDAFRLIYSPDYSLEDSIHHTFANLIFTSLKNIYELQLNVFDIKLISRIVSYFDANINYIDQGKQSYSDKPLRTTCI